MKIAPEDLKKYVGKKIRRFGWDEGDYCVPKFIGTRYVVYESKIKKQEFHDYVNEGWETYEDPKKKEETTYKQKQQEAIVSALQAYEEFTENEINIGLLSDYIGEALRKVEAAEEDVLQKFADTLTSNAKSLPLV